MNKIIDGKQVSNKLKSDLKREVEKFSVKPKLVVIKVGDDPASTVYVEHKRRACQEVGIDFELVQYDTGETTEILESKIHELNAKTDVTGILIQLPLPDHLDSKKLINLVEPSKDVDGLTVVNAGKLLQNEDTNISCTAYGIIKLIDAYNINLEGKHIVIIGRSNLVGKPLIPLLLNRNATVTICHSKTEDIEILTMQADVLIVAIGKKHFVKKEMIKKNAILIDVGINRVEKKLYGDIDFENVFDKCSLITPVPGGVGPMTVATLINNIIDCHKRNVK